MEHANGVIKARWGSLKKMPIDIRSDEDVPRCSNWITSCVVLHNLLIFLRDEFEYAVVPAIDDAALGDAVSDQPSPPAKQFQNAVRVQHDTAGRCIMRHVNSALSRSTCRLRSTNGFRQE